MIVKRFSIIVWPIYAILLMKVYQGIKMFFKRFSGGTFQRYYVASWSFYWSALTQMIIIMIVSLNLITDLVFWLWLLSMSLLIMAWIVMNMHNKLIKE